MPRVGIVILNWDNLTETMKCLESVFRSTYQDFFTVVIDNASADNPHPVLMRQYPQVTFFRNERNLGYTGACNQGIGLALEHGAEYVWLLNNDAQVLPDTLQGLVAAMQADAGIGLISPAIYDHRAKALLSLGAAIQPDTLARENIGTLEQYRALVGAPARICLYGTALLMRRELVDQIGLLDERFFAYLEDLDYCLRALERGWKNAVEPGSVILHETHPGKKERILFYITRNQLLLIKKHSLPAHRKRNIGRYLSDSIRRAGHYKKVNENKSSSLSNSMLDGLWCAYKGWFGEWQFRQSMPSLLRSFLLWHPDLLGRLILVFNR